LLCVIGALAGCSDMGRLQTASPSPAGVPKPARTVAATQSPAAEREHERILAAYGGAYDDPQLEGLITKIRPARQPSSPAWSATWATIRT
jgi:predicted Zn-dependent protease